MDGGAPSEDDRGPSRGEESRDRLVAAAVELVAEHYRSGTGLREVFAYLTPGAVASRAGLSRALLYHHWGEPGQDGPSAFERFLGDVAERLVDASVPTDDLGGLAELLPANVSDVIVTLSSYEMNRSDGWASEEWRASMSLALQGAGPTAPTEDLIVRLAGIYRRLGERLALEPVAPLTHEDVALAVMAVIDGFSLHVGVIHDQILKPVDWTPVTPHSSASERPPDWTIVAIAVEGVVHNMMRPTGSAG